MCYDRYRRTWNLRFTLWWLRMVGRQSMTNCLICTKRAACNKKRSWFFSASERPLRLVQYLLLYLFYGHNHACLHNVLWILMCTCLRIPCVGFASVTTVNPLIIHAELLERTLDLSMSDKVRSQGCRDASAKSRMLLWASFYKCLPPTWDHLTHGRYHLLCEIRCWQSPWTINCLGLASQ